MANTAAIAYAADEWSGGPVVAGLSELVLNATWRKTALRGKEVSLAVDCVCPGFIVVLGWWILRLS